MNSLTRIPSRLLLLCADQLRADALRCYGNAVVDTPHIDRLASSGRRFAHHYTVAVPCGPSRASLLTGLYPLTHRIVHNRTPFDPNIPNIASILNSASVSAYLIGYTDTAAAPFLNEADAEGVMPGFSVYAHFNLNDHGLRPWVRTLESRGYGPFDNPFDVFGSGSGEAASFKERRRSIYDVSESDTAFLADQTIACIAEHRDEPWLIHTAFLRPHGPLVAPAPYDSQYSGSAMPPPVRAATRLAERELHPFLANSIDHLDLEWTAETDVAVGLASAEMLAEIRSVYLGLVAELDYHVGRIIAALESFDLMDTTSIVFTSDHGDLLGDHWLFGSRGFFDAAYHVPLIITTPKSRNAIRELGPVDGFTESVDIVPTILDLMGLPPMEWTDGHSLMPFLYQANPRWTRNATFWEYDFRNACSGELERVGVPSTECALNVWRTKSHKYVHFTALPPLLFDLDSDPEELVDRVREPKYRDVLLKCTGDLLSHRIKHADQRRANLAPLARPVV